MNVTLLIINSVCSTTAIIQNNIKFAVWASLKARYTHINQLRRLLARNVCDKVYKELFPTFAHFSNN